MPAKQKVHEAAFIAAKAFDEYRHIAVARKILFLERIAQLIEDHRIQLSAVAARETALEPDRLETEISRTVNQLKLFAGLLKEGSWVRAIIDHAEPGRTPLPKPDIRQMQYPLGPVAVFGASNFPFAYSVIGGDSVSALAAGCPVVYKINPGHPETSQAVTALVLSAAKETDMPEGIFTMLGGTDHETGIELVTHPLIKAVGFTGSLKGGRALFDAAAKREEPIPVYAEMGSVNPVFILPEILQQRGTELAKTLAGSNTASVGQFCTNPGIIISEKSPQRKIFMETFAHAIKFTEPARMLTPGIFENFEKSVDELGKKHVSLISVSGTDKNGHVRARMFDSSAKDFLKDKELWEEVFGPASIHVASENVEDMLEIARKLEGQLTVSIWGTEEDLESNKTLLQVLELKAGRIIINGIPTGVEVTPAMNHGGPYPATTDSKFTSVGTQSIYRFTRPVCYQNFPPSLLPEALKEENPLKIWRLVDNEFRL